MAEDINQSAPVQADNAAETVPQNAPVTEATESTANTTNNAVPTEASFDPRTSFDGLRTQFDTLNKSYSELRKVYTQQSQGYSSLKKQLDDMAKVFVQATKQEVSPEDFMKSLQSQGPKALDPLKTQWQQEIKEQYDAALAKINEERIQDRSDFELMRRRSDTSNYPDFAKLEAQMAELANSENCPVDWGQGPAVVYDTLYKLARAASADNAIKEAHARGLKEAESKIAKESATAVAGGGKAGSITNPSDFKNIADMRKHFVAQLGEAE